MDALHDALQILATDDEGTRRALTEARRLSADGNVRVILLVPQTFSYFAIPGDAEETRRVADSYRRIAAAVGVDAMVRLCVCRSIDDVFRWMLGRGARIVVGGRRRWWWPTPAQRTADRLRHLGYDVVFAPL